MARIQVLSESVADRIAAGEVVERPASVIRELIDNALDAGACRLEIELGGGGRELVSIADDGSGLDRDDALLAFERHATSKIRIGEDLEQIETLGFRGEALAAIAAVSRVEMVTRAADSQDGTRVVIDRGKVITVEPASRAIGTTVAVRRLFSGIPARRKFLKSPATELEHCQRVIRRIALARPEVGFRARQENKVLLAASPSSAGERVRTLLTPRAVQALVELRHEAGEFRLEAWAGRSDLHRYNRDGIHLFVNRRPVRDPLLLRAVSDAYRNRIPPGRFPLIALFLYLPAGDVDVNVHPAKSEVRFHRPREVRALVVGTLEKGLGSRDAIPAFGGAGVAPSAEWSPPPQVPGTALPAGADPQEGFSFNSGQLIEAGPHPDAASDRGDFAHGAGSAPSGGPRALAQFRNTFILAEDESGLLIVDQHVAHERMNYEALLAEMDGGGIARQALVFPRPLEVGPRQAELAREHSAALERLGFGLEEFGPDAVMVRQVPAILGKQARPEALLPILESLDQGDRAGAKDLFDHLVATVSCHASVKKGYPLTPEKMNYLLQGLEACESPSHCPHGRVISLRIDLAKINRNFDRN